jgi:hypothetical protein
MRLSSWLLAGSIAASLSCGPKPPPDNPFITTDRGSIGFGQEFGSGTFIGTKPMESLSINNEGLSDLHISSITLTGDPEFSMMPQTTPPVTVKGEQSTFVALFFAPTQVKTYTANLNIKSDAENTKSLDVAISGKGLQPADAGP